MPLSGGLEILELHELRVHVERVVHVPGADAPEERPHVFRYEIRIENGGDAPVTLLARKWVVTDETAGDTLVVEGDGVVGRTPRLCPGECFSYHSFHLVRGNSVAQGAYFGVLEDGRRIFTRIPQFAMVVPAGAGMRSRG